MSDDRASGDRSRADKADSSIKPSASDTKTIERLEQALERETQTTEALRTDLERLREEVARIELGFKEQLSQARTRREQAEAKLADQSARLNALGAGREQTMRDLQETRAELARVAADRDRLQKELTAVAGMQTETVAFSDGDDPFRAPAAVLPTLEELMASWDTLEDATEEPWDARATAATGEGSAEGADPLDQEMISPELVFVPEDFGDEQAPEPDIEHAREPAAQRGEPDDAGRPRATKHPNSCVLVFHGADPPIKYPLFKDVVTIGRSEAADIQVRDDFISRVHARITLMDWGAVVEDAGSKNGILVNHKAVVRQPLHHGDVLTVGRLRFTFVEAAPERQDS